MDVILYLNNFATIAQRPFDVLMSVCMEADDVERSIFRFALRALIQVQTHIKFVINPNTLMWNNVIMKYICNFASLYLILQLNHFVCMLSDIW